MSYGSPCPCASPSLSPSASPCPTPSPTAPTMSPSPSFPSSAGPTHTGSPPPPATPSSRWCAACGDEEGGPVPVVHVAGPPTLPITGAPAVEMTAGVGLVLVLAGAATLVAARRRARPN